MLWQTAILRLSKLRVRDEINECAALLRHQPVRGRSRRCSATSSPSCAARWGSADEPVELGPVISMGSWIGGDRDGNPFVTAEVMRLATSRQAEVALGHHLGALHRALASSCRCRRGWSRRPPALLELAERSGDDSPFRADEPYRRALRGMHARLHAFAADRARRRCPGRRRTPRSTPYGVDRRAGRRPRRRGRRRCAPTAPATLADAARRCRCAARSRSFGAHLCGLDIAPELGGPRGVIAELLAAAGDVRRLPRARRAGAGRRARRRAAVGAAAAQPVGDVQRRHRAASWRCSTRRPAPCAATAPAIVPALRDLQGRVGQRRARGGGAAEGGRAAACPATAPTTTIDIVPLFETIDDLQRAPADAGRAARRARLPAAGRRPRRLAGGDDRLLRLQQGRRLPHLARGRCTRPRRSWSPVAARAPACGCACSTVAAARSVAAAARPTRRSWPSRRAASTARCGSPSRARWSPPSTPTRPRPGATWRRWWRRRSRPRSMPRRRSSGVDDRVRRGRWPSSPSGRCGAYRALVYDDPRFVEFFRAITPIGEIARLNIGSRPASRTAVGPHRGPAGDPVGVRLVAVPAVAAGVVRRRHGVRRASSPTSRRRPTLLRRDVRQLAVLPLDHRQHGHGAGQDRPGRSAAATPSWSTTSSCATRVIGTIAAEHERTAALARHASPARPTCWPTTRRWPAASPTASRTSIRCTCCRSRCSAATAPATTTSSSAAALELTINAIATGLRNSG